MEVTILEIVIIVAILIAYPVIAFALERSEQRPVHAPSGRMVTFAKRSGLLLLVLVVVLYLMKKKSKDEA